MFATVRQLAARVRALFSRERLDHELVDELRIHLEMEVEANLARGMTPEEARRTARIRVGNPQSLREQHRAIRALPFIDAFLQDLRFAGRLIAKDRWFSAAAIGAIALGIGVNAAGFSLVNSVFLKGLPFEESDRLHVLTWQTRVGRRANVSYPELLQWRTRSTSFDDIAATWPVTVNISDDRTLSEEARAAWITANTFGLLRRQPMLGRDFEATDERPGAAAAVIIGERIWRSRYGGDPGVLGKSMRVDAVPATIVGVMPADMKFPENTGIWLPFNASMAQKGRVLATIARLKPGRTRDSAQAEMNVIGRQQALESPAAAKDLTGAIRVETFTERSVGGSARPMFYTVMGAGVFVLLIACANVANLLLSRSAHRAREIAMRTALGASRGRIVRQLLTESLVISVIGGGIGLLLATAGVQLFDAAMPPVMPFWIVFKTDYTVFAYVASICGVTALLFGLAPALHVSKSNAHDVLKEGGRGVTGSRRLRWFTSSLVVAELALTIVLLAGAGLMIRSFVTLYSIDLGIDSDRLLTMRLQLPDSKYHSPESRRDFFDRLQPRLAAVPGVDGAALTNGVPPNDGGERFLEVDQPVPGLQPVMVGTVAISPAFFDVVGVSLLRGRGFAPADGAPGAEAVIINDRLAQQFYPGQDPLGRRLRFTERGFSRGQSTDIWRTIVGISPSIKHGSPEDRYANAVVYIPYRQESVPAVSLLQRSTQPAASGMEAAQRAVQAIDRDLPVLPIQTATEIVAETQWWYRVWGGVFGAVAVVALLLSSFGLYAVIAYTVTQRQQEIGVRMAIGARPRQVCWLVLKRGLAQLAVALPLGLFAALVLVRVVWARGVGPIAATDPLTFAAITSFLVVVALAACIVPARRATTVDPIAVLRAD